MTIFLFLISLLLAANLAATCAVLRHFPADKERRMPDRKEDVLKDPMDEGFENIMRFTVNGKTGFEE